ncbi:MAG: ABC transporter permease [Bacteroidales bacterium]
MLLKLSWRNLWRNKRRTLITISSVLFAVLLAIVFDSMERGSYERMIDSMVKLSTGYLQIQDVLYEDEPSIDNSLLFDDELRKLLSDFDRDIAYYVPRIQNFALAATSDQTRGTRVIGIEPKAEIRLNELNDKLVDGSFLEQDDQEVMIAEGLADILGAQTGDTIILLGQGFQGSTAAGKYRIKGIVDLKIPELNNNTVYMSLSAAQWFYLAEDRLSALIIMPERPKHTAQLAKTLSKRIDGEWYRVVTWDVLLQDLLKLMQFDMAGTMVMLMILYVIIAFGLFGTIITMMVERQMEFGMLISLGMKRHQLALVCFMESVFITITGVVAGMILAIPIIFYFNLFPIQLTGEMAEAMISYGFEPIMPFSTDPVVFLSQAKVVLIISVLIGLYPVYKIFRLNIMQVKK